MPTATKDAVLGSAVDVARAAAVEVAENPGHVGEHLGLVVEGERLVSHRFACTAPGYRGWQWTVTVTRVPRARAATVCEAVLLPGDGAVLAPAWVPWSERLRPGDIGPGDVLPFSPDDPRLEPGYVPTGDEDEDRVAIEELALARARVLSPRGKDEAADRWYAGTRGPTSPAALAAAAPCGSCGFLVRMIGSLGTVFGVCANEWSPDDGKVVSLDHGCGAHSETDVEPQPSEWPAPGPSIDELEVEIVSRIVAHAAAGTPVADDAVDTSGGTPTPAPVASTGADDADAAVEGAPDADAPAAGASDADVPDADAPDATGDAEVDADTVVDAEPDPDAALLPGTQLAPDASEPATPGTGTGTGTGTVDATQHGSTDATQDGTHDDAPAGGTAAAADDQPDR